MVGDEATCASRTRSPYAGSSVRRALLSAGLLSALLLCSVPGAAFESLLPRLPRGGRLSALIGDTQARAVVRDGPLLGEGVERTELLGDGTLRVTRSRTYTQARRPDSGRLVALPEPWRIRSTLLLSPSLRLLRADTTLELHRSADRALRYPLSEKLSELFEQDRVSLRAAARGASLVRTLYLRGRRTDRSSYAYPRDAIPLDIISLVLAIAVRNRVERFDYQLLLPDGSSHGVRARVYRTRDPTPFARDYRLPVGSLRLGAELAIVDMSLASPIKHLFYPHHFYFVYASDDPAKLLALWGGDPDEPLYAFRRP